jgi:hypothetical protein
MNGPIIGKPPGPDDKADFAAAANLAPDKSLLRIQESAKFVFANVAVIGTLLTGLGLFTDLGDVLENSAIVSLPWGDVPVPVLALGLSLFCASVALWPKMSSVELARPDEVNRWYRQQIFRRGLWMIASLALFSSAILVATLTGISSIDEPEKPSISASWTGIGEEAAIKVSVEAEKVPHDWTMITSVRGTSPSGKQRTIFHDRTQPDADGALTVAGEIEVGERFGRIESTAYLVSDKGEDPGLESKSVIKGK